MSETKHWSSTLPLIHLTRSDPMGLLCLLLLLLTIWDGSKMLRVLLCGLLLLMLTGCDFGQRPDGSMKPVDEHILPAVNHGCDVSCKDGIVTIRCPFKYGCKSEGEAVCVVEHGEIRTHMACCPMYTVCRACKCLKDGTYKGYCKDGVCVYTVPLAK